MSKLPRSSSPRLFDEDDVSMEWPRPGVIRIGDPAGLAAQLGLDQEQMTNHPHAFVEDGDLIGPWEITELVITTAARQRPGPILEYIAKEERQARHEAIHGRWYRLGRKDDDHYVEPEPCVELDNEHYRPRRDVLRSWCGQQANDRFDELTELRKEVRRVGDVAQAAIDALRAAGGESEAACLQRDLGTPVESLRPPTRISREGARHSGHGA